MRLSRPVRFTKIVLLSAASAIPCYAQDISQLRQSHHEPRYEVTDLGTFGGSNSYYFLPIGTSLSGDGRVAGAADTIASDTDVPCFGNACLAVHAFEWNRSHLNDLGVLPGGANSAAIYINDSGQIAGFADNGKVDPFTGAPDLVAVAWDRGNMIDIGTFGGSFSFPNAINQRGEIVGVALDAVPDTFSMMGLGTRTHAFLWRNGNLRDLGTMGGTDSWAAYINDRGEVAGWSYTDTTVHPATGVPTQHPFIWERGRFRDLGTLGGTYAVVASYGNSGGGAINNRGQVAGTSNLSGDENWHPYLWSEGRMTDLGTLGGPNGEAYWINENGDVVGRADVAGGKEHHAFLWRTGRMIDLGAAPGWPCSTALAENSRGEVIIDTGICGVGGGPGMVWRDGKSYDLNTLIPTDLPFAIGDLFSIDDRGDIAAVGVFPNGDIHDLLLVPSREE